MTHTTPEQAFEMADKLRREGLEAVPNALRSLAEQLDAVTAECEKFANQTFKAKAEAKTLIDHANAGRDAYKLDALRYRWWVRVVTGGCRLEVEEAFGSISMQLTPPTAEQFASCIDAAIAKEAK